MPEQSSDLIIIGGGPAGLTAAIYSTRARVSTLMIERGAFGGQMALSDEIENYPGFPEPITGTELSEKMRAQAMRFGLETTFASVKAVSSDGRQIKVETDSGNFTGKAAIVATGTEPRQLGVAGETEFRGRGVSYCATCDGPFFKDMELVVVGGGDSAIQEAIFLTRFAAKITVIHRRDALRATKILQEKAVAEPKIGFLWDSELVDIRGNDTVGEVTIRNKKTRKETVLGIGGVFIYVGTIPNTQFLDGGYEMDERKFVVTDEHLQTSVPGVFAAGDCRKNQFKQIAVAVGEGALAAESASGYIEGLSS